MQKLFTIILLMWTLQTGAQSPCYVLLNDASGYTPTQAQMNELEAAACRLRDSLPAEFQGSFKVFDFGFYLHNETFTGGYPEAFQMAIQQAQDQSDYYLLFGKQTDQNGMYTKFWVELVLPDTAGFSCVDLVSPSFRNNLKLKTDYIVNESYDQLGNIASSYDVAEIAAMDSLATIISSIVLCCDPLRQSVSSCSFCLFSDIEIYNILEKNGFFIIPIEVNNLVSRNNSMLRVINNSSIVLNDYSDALIKLKDDEYYIDSVLIQITNSIPTNENINILLTDNASFCEIDFKMELTKLYNNFDVNFQWIHVWKNEAQPLNSYLLFNSNFGYKDNVIRDLGFTGYLDKKEELTPALVNTIVISTVKDIYFKNKYIIDVKFEDKANLINSDLYLRVANDFSGTPYSVLGKTVYNENPHGPLTDKYSFIKYRFFSPYENSIKRHYTFSFAVSHEFMHQIVTKSYMYIYDQEQNPLPLPIPNLGDGHVNGEKNLLFPGDGLCSDLNSHLVLLPEDRVTGNCGHAYFFSGRYVPSFLKESLDPWEKIYDKQKGLLYMYYMLKALEPKGLNSPEYILQKEIYNKFIVSERYWK